MNSTILRAAGWLRTEREHAELTPAELAEYSSISERAIRRIERGAKAERCTLVKLAGAFAVHDRMTLAGREPETHLLERRIDAPEELVELLVDGSPIESHNGNGHGELESVAA